MAFSRSALCAEAETGDALTRAMIGIGMLFAGRATKHANIEDTLLAASVQAVVKEDLRVASVLTTWLGVHHAYVNVDRLVRAVPKIQEPRVQAFWAAVGQWLSKDRRYLRLARVYRGTRVPLVQLGNDFLLRRRGEDARFKETHLIVAAGTLRDRAADVVSPKELAKAHRAYRYRILLGPTYRADMWAALDRDSTLTVAELARETYGSFATAWQVKREWETLNAA